jgi:hypothetical protein
VRHIADTSIPETIAAILLAFVRSTSISCYLERNDPPPQSDLHALISMHIRFVFQLTPEFGKNHVSDGTRKSAITHHSFHIQVLDSDDIKPLSKIRGEFVQSVLTNITNPRMQLGKFFPCFFSILRSF